MMTSYIVPIFILISFLILIFYFTGSYYIKKYTHTGTDNRRGGDNSDGNDTSDDDGDDDSDDDSDDDNTDNYKNKKHINNELGLYTWKKYTNKPNKINKKDKPNKINKNKMRDMPYSKKHNMDPDDYEYSMIFQNEDLGETSEAMVNYAMSRYPLDWSLRPPSDAKFQSYREAFIDASQKDMRKIPSSVYDKIDGTDMIPENTQQIKEEEMKLLKTYKPETSSNLLKYSIGDVKALVDKYYGLQGLEPVLAKSSQGDNVYEIVEVKNKNEPIVWEDEYEENQQKNKMRGESQIKVPSNVAEVTAGNDPYYEARGQRLDKTDYTKWTSKLDRQFTPSYPAKNWY